MISAFAILRQKGQSFISTRLPKKFVGDSPAGIASLIPHLHPVILKENCPDLPSSVSLAMAALADLTPPDL